MQIKFIFFLIISTIVVVFAAQNHTPVDVKFLQFRIEAVPVSVIILLSMLCGTLIMAVFELLSYITLKFEMRRKNSEIKKLKKEMEKNEPENDENRESKTSEDN